MCRRTHGGQTSHNHKGNAGKELTLTWFFQKFPKDNDKSSGFVGLGDYTNSGDFFFVLFLQKAVISQTS